MSTRLSTLNSEQLVKQSAHPRIETTMTVNELARRTGVAPHVVRYYSQRGFLSPRRNARNAYREYGESDVHRLRFIRRAKALGFTLKEIGLILGAADGGVVAQATQLVRARAAAIERRNADAERVHRRIRDAIAHWPTVADDATSPPDMRVLIDAVAQEE